MARRGSDLPGMGANIVPASPVKQRAMEKQMREDRARNDLRTMRSYDEICSDRGRVSEMKKLAAREAEQLQRIAGLGKRK